MMPPMHQIIEHIRQTDNFLITSHMAPDGDALGSMLAMAELLQAMGKHLTLFNESGLPDRFAWLSPQWTIAQKLPPKMPDSIIVTDCGAAERVGPVLATWMKTRTVLNLDHHLGNPLFGTLNWIEERASSVGEMVGMLARELGVPLAGRLGQYVYLALVSDTGDFCFSNTRPETMEMAADILRQGFQPAPFHEQRQSTGTLAQLQMRAEVLQQARLFADGRISLISFSRDLFRRTGTGPEDTEGLVNTVLCLRNVQVAVCLREEKDRVKFSLRSKGSINVQAVAATFGGGGHRNASGGHLFTSLQEAAVLLVQAVTRALQDA